MIVHECRDGMERARGRGAYADVDDDDVPCTILPCCGVVDGMGPVSKPFMVPSHGDCMRDGCPRDGCDLPSDIALLHAGGGSSVAAVDVAPASTPTMEPSNGVATEQSN